MPEINDFTESDIAEYFACDLAIHPVVPIDATYPVEQVPAYMIEKSCLFDFLREETGLTDDRDYACRILDFGRGEFVPSF